MTDAQREPVVYLSFRHPRRLPDEVTAALRIDPDRCWNKGAARNTPDGRPLSGRHDYSYWIAQLPIAIDEFEGLGKAIEACLDRLEPQKAFVQEFTCAPGYGELSVYWDFYGTAEARLSPDLMARVSSFGLTLDLKPLWYR